MRGGRGKVRRVREGRTVSFISYTLSFNSELPLRENKIKLVSARARIPTSSSPLPFSPISSFPLPLGSGLLGGVFDSSLSYPRPPLPPKQKRTFSQTPFSHPFVRFSHPPFCLRKTPRPPLSFIRFQLVSLGSSVLFL